MTSIDTPQAFIRALKAPSDPPAQGGRLKIEIARQIWDDSSFLVPNKAEVVVDWILSKFLKEKDNEITLNPLLDLRFWTLLNDVITSTSTGGSSGTQTRPLKIWLPPLLSRIPVAPSLVALLRLLGRLDPALRSSVVPVIFSSLAIIWPVSAQKINTEAMLECFGAFLTAYHGAHVANDYFMRIGSLITTSYRNSVSNSSNKKKVYSVFLQNYLPHWLELHALSGSHAAFSDVVYDAGIETLFNLDILRRSRDSKTDTELFEAIAPVLTSNADVYAVLPRLFASYIESIKKYRGALVSQSSSQTPGSANAEIQTKGIQFLASCLLLLDAHEQSVKTWSARVALLKVVDKESLFDRRNTEAAMVLDRAIGHALESIDIKTANDLASYAIECLSTLARIDYDMIVPLVPRVLSKLLLLSGPHVSSLEFLDLILAYHNKTRTVNTFAEGLVNALSSAIEAASSNNSPIELYQSALSSPLFNAIHLKRLSKALQAFLSGSQVLPLTQHTFNFLKQTWEKCNVGRGHTEERSPKRRRTVNMGSTSSAKSQEDCSAVVFSLLSHLAMTVFSSLPLHTVTQELRDELRSLLNDIRIFAARIVKKVMKPLTKSDQTVWSLSVISSASLRLWYALDVSGQLAPVPFDDEKLYKRALKALQNGKLLPELLIEVFRFLFHVSLHRDQSSSQAAFNHSLAYLEKNFQVSPASWSGQLHRLSLDKQGQKECALALMHMIVERWLPVIETFASTEQLQRLIQVMMSIGVAENTCRSIPGLQAETLLLQVLHSAQFWELHKVRVVFLSHLEQIVSGHDDVSNTDSISASTTVGAYRLLLTLPVEYLSRSARADFARRALNLDRHISSSAMPLKAKSRDLTVLRAFLSRVFSIPNGIDFSVEHLCDALKHLITSETSSALFDETLEATTTGLLKLIFFETFKKLQHSSSDVVSNLISDFAQIDLRLISDFRAQSFIHMITVLNGDFKFKGLPNDLQFAMQQIYQTLSMATAPQLSTLQIETASVEDARDYTRLMMLWRSLLCLRRWIGSTDAPLPFLATTLFSRLSAWNHDSTARYDIHVAALAILLEEFDFCPENDRSSRLDYITAAYTYTLNLLPPCARQQVERFLPRLCSNLSASEFSQLLDLITEDLNCNDSSEMRINLLQMSTDLLRSHPQGTLKQTQAFSSRCLQILLSWRDLTDCPIELRLQALEFVAKNCAEQPAVLRIGDMGSIWILVTNFLAGSSVHDKDTTPEIFHKIINIISALIRLRRDLVIHTLPHLGSVLRQLLMMVRTVRPSLGIKQTSLVTATLPRWVNAKQPIGVGEVKVLSRLLETLTTKSMVRNNAPNSETQKAESLAKPFSKHAAYVLKAYITAMNDPLCLLPSEHRRELQRGLYALCSMIGDHNRDAMMVSALDAGGKLMMKALWKEYEKQRYVGKG
ncbi:hypothetical protein H2248_000586 [Termitomyces sp. 'cryptogamus']|nr:hypothetical protein H2248_000586 [Termitomyces sp. 'cryptogamus']